MHRRHRLRRIGEEVRALPLRDTVACVARGYDEHDVLTFAAAIAFQVLFALIPLALVGVGLLGILGLDGQWTQEWSAKARSVMSPDAFRVVDDTVRKVLTQREVFWTTAGAAFAVWKISAATRALMDVLDRVYGSERERSFAERLRVSLLLGTGVGVLLLMAVAAAVLGDDVLRAAGLDGPLLWLRWPVALALLFAVVGLLIAFGPVDRHHPHWVTFGSIVVVAAWVTTSLVLGWYLTAVADYGSVFGALATIVIVLSYLFFASAAVLTGAQLDAIVRDQVQNGGAAVLSRPAAAGRTPPARGR